MGEIDTKSIESVQSALSLFGERSDQRKNRSTSCDQEVEKEREIEGLLQDLANVKIQLEAKDSSYKQAVLKLDHYRKTADGLSSLLKNSEFEKDSYINESKEAWMHIDELESKLKDMADQILEFGKIREQLSHVISELNAAQSELLTTETELAAARETKLEAITQAELMETALSMEKVETEKLLRHVSELNEIILHSKLAAIEADEEKCTFLSEKEAELQLATITVAEAHEQLDCMRKQLEMMHNLENQLLDKSVFIDTLQLELQQANELHSSSEKSASDAINELNQLKLDLEMQERKNSDQAGYNNSLETELNQLKQELRKANEEVGCLNCEVQTMKVELEAIKSEMDEVKGTENEAQVEIALLRSELHRGRSKIAAAEAAEARANSEKSGLYRAVQQLALEAEDAKNEIRRLKQEAYEGAEESENTVVVNLQHENFSLDEEVLHINERKTESEEREDDVDDIITMSKEDYEALVKKAENRHELEILKEELEIAKVKTGEFRTRAEQAVSRAEVAEKAKATLEEKTRRWREQKERRKAASAALREESISQEIDCSKYGNAPKTYQPLGKVLNMEF